MNDPAIKQACQRAVVNFRMLRSAIESLNDSLREVAATTVSRSLPGAAAIALAHLVFFHKRLNHAITTSEEISSILEKRLNP